MEFELSLLDVNGKDLHIQNVNYDSFTILPSNEFSRICKELKAISDRVDIGVNQTCIKFYVDKENIKGGITLNNNDSDDIELQSKTITNTNINYEYLLEYLNIFTKMSSNDQQVNLYLSQTLPFKIQYKLGELGDITFYIAPLMGKDEQ